MSEPNSWTTLGKTAHLGDEVHVTDALNHGDGKVTYLVTTGSISIRRRYSDFQWLHNRLQCELPGSFVPIIPHKRTLGKKDITEEFIETRRNNLEQFLRGVYEIPESKTSSASLRAFFTAGDDLEAAKKSVEAANPSFVSFDDDEPQDQAEKVKKGLTNLFAKAVTVTQNRLGNVELKETKEEADITALKDYIAKMETHVKDLQSATQVLLQTTSDKALAFGAFAAPVAEWKFSRDAYFGEDNEWTKPFGNVLLKTAKNSQEVGSLFQAQFVQEMNELEEGLQKLSLGVKAFQKALKTRKKLQVLFTTRGKQIQDKEAMVQNPGKKDARKLKSELSDLERSSASLGQTLQECSERLVREATRVLPGIEQSFQVALQGFAKVQVEHARQVQEAWASLLPSLGATNGAVGASPSPKTPAPAPAAAPPPTPLEE